MSKKRDIKRRGATLREYVLVPINDPVEQALLDRKRQRAMRAIAAAETTCHQNPADTDRLLGVALRLASRGETSGALG